jgi:hypothetical protein
MDKFMIDPKPEPINESPKPEENISMSTPIEEPSATPIPTPYMDKVPIPLEPPTNEFIPPEPVYRTSWILWIFILLGFLAFYFYYTAKYTANESHYIIKSNAKTFKISLNEFKEDLKAWFLGWAKWADSYNDNLYDKSSQFFFRQHLENGAFVSKQSMNQKEKEKEKEKEDKK